MTACLALLLLALAALPEPAQADPTASPVPPPAAESTGRVWVWSHEHFEGEPRVLALRPEDRGVLQPFERDLVQHGVDNLVAALRWSLPSGTLVTFYEHADGTGREFTLSTPRGNNPSVLNLHFWGAARAWRWTHPDIRKGMLVLHAEPDMQGERIMRHLEVHAPNTLHSLDSTEMDHRVDSLSWLLPAGVQVTLYEHANGSGAQHIVGPGAGQILRLSEIPDRTFAEAWSWKRSTGQGSWLLLRDHALGVSPITLSETPPNSLQMLTDIEDPTHHRRSPKGGMLSWSLPPGTQVVLYSEPSRGGTAWVLSGHGAEGPRLHPTAWEWRRGDLSQDLTSRQRPYDENTWLVAQAADASRAEGWPGAWHQSGNLESLLKAGIRGLELQAISRNDELLLVRGDHEWSVGIGRSGRACRPLFQALKTVASFLDQHPREVVTIFLDDADPDGPGRLQAGQLDDVLARAGLSDQIFDVSDFRNGLQDTWPTPGMLIQEGRRLVLFRGPLREPTEAPRPKAWRPGRSDLGSMGAAAIATVLDSRRLRTEVETWVEHQGSKPTFVSVDFAIRGAHGGPRRLVRELNAERARDASLTSR